MHFIPPDPALAAVDIRFLVLDDERQRRVIDVLLVVASCPMRLAVDAVLAVDKEMNRDAETK